jgi:hypothetical protein
MLFISRTTELNYDLATAYTFTGTNDSTTFSTTLGDLIMTGASGNATFTAALATVPEPSALALLGLGAAGPRRPPPHGLILASLTFCLTHLLRQRRRRTRGVASLVYGALHEPSSRQNG